MIRNLGWIAIGGLGIGIASLSLAYAIGGRDVDAFGLADTWGSSCGDSSGPRERRLAWDGGDSVELSLPGTVRWRAGDGDELVVRGAPGLVANVQVHGSRLVLGCRGRSGRSGSLEVTLPGRTFQRVAIAGSGKLVLEKLAQPELALRISGSGSMQAQGNVDRLTVNVSGSGDARLGELAARQATVHISGSGKVEASPKDKADISISGSGDVKLLTRPADLRSKVSGSGRITQAAEK